MTSLKLRIILCLNIDEKFCRHGTITSEKALYNDILPSTFRRLIVFFAKSYYFLRELSFLPSQIISCGISSRFCCTYKIWIGILHTTQREKHRVILAPCRIPVAPREPTQVPVSPPVARPVQLLEPTRSVWQRQRRHRVTH